MRVLLLKPGTEEIRLGERPLPRLVSPRSVRVQVLDVGICGTDREQAAGQLGKAPRGSEWLVPGHEMLGRVMDVGNAVRRVRGGDLVVLTVRRGCSRCVACKNGRPDLCESGQYCDRGVVGMDGFQAQVVVDNEDVAIRVPRRLRPVGVLCEPFSVVEKAIDQVDRIQRSRVPWLRGSRQWLRGRPCLVVGLGPIGLLAAMLLTLKGAKVTGIDRLPCDHPRVRWFRELGGNYVQGWDVLGGATDLYDVIVEAAGATDRFADQVRLLARNGILAYVGNACKTASEEGDAYGLLRHLVIGNKVVVGIVNAGREHYRAALRDLGCAVQLWGMDFVARLITHRVPPEDAIELLRAPRDGEIKAVIGWGEE